MDMSAIWNFPSLFLNCPGDYPGDYPFTVNMLLVCTVVSPIQLLKFHLFCVICLDMDIHGNFPLNIVMLIRPLMCTDVY